MVVAKEDVVPTMVVAKEDVVPTRVVAKDDVVPTVEEEIAAIMQDRGKSYQLRLMNQQPCSKAAEAPKVAACLCSLVEFPQL